MNRHAIEHLLRWLDQVRAAYPHPEAFFTHTDRAQRMRYFEACAAVEDRAPGYRVEYQHGRHVLVPDQD